MSNIPRTIPELVAACAGCTAEQVRTIVDLATSEACPEFDTPEEALYQAIYEEGLRLDPAVANSPEPFRASIAAIGMEHDIQGMLDW